MKPIIVKNKESGKYDLRISIKGIPFECRNLTTKLLAEDVQEIVISGINEIKISKLKETLTDSEINLFAVNKYPYIDKGNFINNAIQDALRKEFIKTAKFVRDKFLEINLK